MKALRPLVVAAKIAAAALLLAGCAAGPDYRRPVLEMPVAWKVEAPCREGAPNDLAAKGPWWLRFGDPQLDALEQQALAGSPTLVAANARLIQARAVVAASTSSLLPQVGLNLRATRQKISADRPLTNYASPNFSTVQNDLQRCLPSTTKSTSRAACGGRSRARASAEQSAADLENVRLLLTAELATDYFSLRELDIELDVLSRSIDLQRRALELATARHDLGAASGLDVAQQQALLDSTLTQVDVLRRQRDQFEHAIATLTGTTAAPIFALAQEVRDLIPPQVPIGVPSDVLERRPDVASAERAMAVANAQVGVANAAFYPSIILAPAYGAESTSLSSLFNAPSLLWSLGVSIAQPLFDAGRLRANLDFAKAGYDITVANYRRVVLTAMQEAEDGITGMAALDRASAQARVAIASARRVLDIATSRYEGGVATYLEVITAQQGLLSSERLAAQLQGQLLLTSVFLVKALGAIGKAARAWQTVREGSA